MLEVRFDDSGTHFGSDVVVWGGVAGHMEFFNDLELAWKATLEEPCDGRPPIRRFHSAELFAGKGEFEGYNQAEKDLTRHNFRRVITDLKLSVLSFGISVHDWDEIVTDFARETLESPERMLFGTAVKHACEAAVDHGEPLSFQFDKGCYSDQLSSIINSAIGAAKINEDDVSWGWSSVARNVGLQAADLVAHETYRFFCDYLQNRDVKPDPHLSKLFQDAYDSQAAWVGRDELQGFMEEIAPEFTELQRSDETFAEPYE